MSLEEVLSKVNDINTKISAITEDVDLLKKKNKDKEDREMITSALVRSRSRSPRSSREDDRTRRSSRERGERSWADIVDSELHPEEEDVDSSQLIEVSEDTHRLLTGSCTRNMSNEMRKRVRGRYKLPKVEATRTPRMDPVIKTLAPQVARSADKELARIQTFVLDALAPISSILENIDGMTAEDVTEASMAATELLGNANAKISRLRREKLIASINRNLIPMLQDDVIFGDVAPNLFGPDFSRRAKEFLDQVSALKSLTHPTRHSQGQTSGTSYRRPLLHRGPPLGRGSGRGRGGGPSHPHHKGVPSGHGERPSHSH
uniref:Uncharacterized protein n=1 Tax=Amphimedon queenslandica TaxID=400682 RepID=A0A1X7VGZ5_AMPQE